MGNMDGLIVVAIAPWLYISFLKYILCQMFLERITNKKI